MGWGTWGSEVGGSLAAFFMGSVLLRMLCPLPPLLGPVSACHPPVAEPSPFLGHEGPGSSSTGLTPPQLCLLREAAVGGRFSATPVVALAQVHSNVVSPPVMSFPLELPWLAGRRCAYTCAHHGGRGCRP